mmetsp:Transcript_19985/g.18974  ORF Transcript_19985/g.18974 Transcript_19985/m.18974 type:complete len:127 (-) Transcript_19985:386-766(-)
MDLLPIANLDIVGFMRLIRVFHRIHAVIRSLFLGLVLLLLLNFFRSPAHVIMDLGCYLLKDSVRTFIIIEGTICIFAFQVIFSHLIKVFIEIEVLGDNVIQSRSCPLVAFVHLGGVQERIDLLALN